MNKNMLPANVPVFATYHYQLGGMVPAAVNPTGYNWYLNECVMLQCTKKFLDGFTTPEIDVPASSFLENPNLMIRYESLDISFEKLQEQIKKNIDAGWYMYFCGADDYCLPGKSFYGQRHVGHDGLICGYDDEKQIYHVLTYDTNWLCRIIPIPYAAFRTSLSQLMVEKIWFGFLAYIQSYPNSQDLDLFRIRELLKQYTGATLQRHPFGSAEKPAGICVHGYLSKYLELIQKGRIPYERADWRVLRVIWEHKKCMLDRLCAVEKQLNLPPHCSSAYASAVKNADFARLIYARYLKKRDDHLPSVIREKIEDIDKLEKMVLPDVIRDLDKYMQT